MSDDTENNDFDQEDENVFYSEGEDPAEETQVVDVIGENDWNEATEIENTSIISDAHSSVATGAPEGSGGIQYGDSEMYDPKHLIPVSDPTGMDEASKLINKDHYSENELKEALHQAFAIIKELREEVIQLQRSENSKITDLAVEGLKKCWKRERSVTARKVLRELGMFDG